MAEVINSVAMTIFGVSDGGTHTKFFTGGRYRTEMLIKFVREIQLFLWKRRISR